MTAPPEPRPALTATELARLPARLQWEVFGAYLTAGALAAAGAVLDQLAAGGQRTPLLLRAVERLALARGQTDAALAAVRERAERFPSPAHLADLALALLQAGQAAAAGHLLATTLDRHPRDPDLLAARAAVALAGGDPATARAALDQALAASPAHPLAQRLLVRVVQTEGRHDEAQARLAALVAGLDGDDLPPARLADLADLADLAAELGQPDVAARLHARAGALWARRRAAIWQAVAAALGPGSRGAGEQGSGGAGEIMR